MRLGEQEQKRATRQQQRQQNKQQEQEQVLENESRQHQPSDKNQRQEVMHQRQQQQLPNETAKGKARQACCVLAKRECQVPAVTRPEGCRVLEAPGAKRNASSAAFHENSYEREVKHEGQA